MRRERRRTGHLHLRISCAPSQCCILARRTPLSCTLARCIREVPPAGRESVAKARDGPQGRLGPSCGWSPQLPGSCSTRWCSGRSTCASRRRRSQPESPVVASWWPWSLTSSPTIAAGTNSWRRPSTPSQSCMLARRTLLQLHAGQMYSHGGGPAHPHSVACWPGVRSRSCTLARCILAVPCACARYGPPGINYLARDAQDAQLHRWDELRAQP